MDKAKVLDKVTKLLALAQSGGASPNEADIALRQARALMKRYNLESNEIDAHQVSEASVPTRTQRAPAHWLHLLAIACAMAFDARHLSYYHSVQGWCFKFIGMGISPELAAHAYSTLLHQLTKARKEHVAAQHRCKLATKRKRGQIFAEGWISAVTAKVQNFATGMDADTERQVSAYLEHHHPKLKTIELERTEANSRDVKSMLAGWDQGQHAHLHRGVSNTPMAGIGQERGR